LQLEEAGKLSVHDPVRRHLPEFRVSDPNATERITLHHLLSHTSGLPPLPVRRGGQLQAHPERPPRPIPRSVDDLLAYLAEEPYEMLAAPGETFSYSNEGYALLGAVIERVSGEPFAAYVERRILQPLGMRRSTIEPEVVERFPSVAQLYVRSEQQPALVVADAGWPELGPYNASGALRPDGLDVIRCLSCFVAGGRAGDAVLLRPEAVERMRRPVIEYVPGFHYAYGLQGRPLAPGLRGVGHGGSQKGIAAFAGYVPEKGVCGVVLANLIRVPCADIWEAGIRALLGLEPAAEEPPANPPADVNWQEYVGVFCSDEGMELRIRAAEDGRGLVAESEGVASPARWLWPDFFELRARARREEFLFLREAEGNICAVRYHLRVLRKVSGNL